MGETGLKGPTATVTVLLDEVRRGDPNAPGRLFTLVYDKLREIARIQRRRQPSTETLNTTALVHEAFLKLFGEAVHRNFNDRAHFMAVAATAMRQILIGHARRNIAQKRGGGQAPASFEEVERALQSELSSYRRQRMRSSRSIARWSDCSNNPSGRAASWNVDSSAGMSIEETAEALAVSPATVKRDWSMAQAWLHREMQQELG